MATTTLGTFLQHLRGAALHDETAALADGQLVERFVRRRDPAALETLLRRHGPMVWGVCRRVLRHEADAEDAFQATFLVLVRKAADVRPRGMVGNWLYGVARNTALKAKLMNDRRRAKERLATRPAPAAPAEDRERLQALLDEELQALPDKYRASLVLCELEGKSIQEAARHLGCPPGTVGTRLARGRRLLAQRLAGRGVTLSAGGIAAALAAGVVPAPLLAATVRTATAALAGPVAGAVGPQVLALTEGVLKSMLLTKCKTVAALLLAVGVFACVGMALQYPAGLSAAARGDTSAVGEKPAVKPAQPPGRAAQLQELQAEFKKEDDALLKEIRAGKVKEKDGGYPELAALRERYAARVRRLIDADPKDEIALDAILFSMRDLVGDWKDQKLYDVLAEHHLGSAKLLAIVGRARANEKFLRAVLAKTPHAEVRGRATLELADRLTRLGRVAEAESLVETLRQDKELAKLGHHHGNLGKAADNLLFEIRHLSVGKTAPEIIGQDLEKKPMKLSDYRGKVVLLVFWATWCGPCMAMVPHERELAKGYAGKPFAVVGVNGDGDIVYGPKGEEIDQMARVKETIKKEGMTWRSFRNECQIPDTNQWVQISRRWNVDSWPTIYLLDHEGVVRRKYRGEPMRAELDREIKQLVAAAEAGRKKTD